MNRSCDYTRPDVEPWWTHANPLCLAGRWCTICGTRVSDQHGTVHPCPMGCAS